MMEKFMRKRKSNHKKPRNKNTKSISREVVSEEIAKDRLTEITELLEHLSPQEETSVMKFVTDSQARFHIPVEKLTATNILQYLQRMTDL